MKEHSEGSVDLVNLARQPDSGRADHMRSDKTEKFTTELMTGGMGFVRLPETIAYHVDEKLGRRAVEAARHKFSPEFINRLHKLVVFRPLRREQLEEVLLIELRKVQSRVSHSANRPFVFRINEEARKFLLDEGTDQRYGARHLNRTIERILIHPLARLLATDQLRSDDRLLIDLHTAKNCLAFAKDTKHYTPCPGVALGDANPVRRTSGGVQA